MTEALELRETSSMPLGDYAILLIDIESGELLDQTRLGGLDWHLAYRIAAEAWERLGRWGEAWRELGRPLEVDVTLDEGYVKLIADWEAGLLRVLVSKHTGLALPPSP